MPALSFAAGVAGATLVFWTLLILPSRLREGQLQAALASERQARARQAGADARTIADLRQRSTVPERLALRPDALALESAVLTGRLPVPQSVRAMPIQTRGAREEPSPVLLARPVETCVLDPRPLLEAVVPQGASRVRALLADAAGMDVRLATVSASSWRPVSDLRPSETYIWAVEAVVDGRRVPSRVASFEVVKPAVAQAVRLAERQYAGRPLLLAVVYARSGLLDETERALLRVRRVSPQNAAASALLADLRRIRPDARAGP